MNCELTSGVLTFIHEGHQKIILPKKYRSELLREVHNSALGGGHFGIAKTHSKMRKFYWHHMPVDVINYIRECPECQLASQKHHRIPLTPRRTTQAFEIVSVDLCGPMKHNDHGYTYVANFINCFTKYIISLPVKTATAKELAELFVEHIITKFGPPVKLLSDNATNFTARELQDLCNALHSHKVYTTPYHSASNGQVERSFRIFRNVVAKLTKGTGVHSFPARTHSPLTFV